MASIELASAAVEDLDNLITVLSLPPDTRDRVRRSASPLEALPRLGAELTDHREGLRFLLGPWRSMILVYIHDEEHDRVVIVTIQDARTAPPATSSRNML